MPTQAKFAGRYIDDDGKFLENVAVNVYDAGTNTPARAEQADTDGNGKWDLTPTAGGPQYDIVAVSNGKYSRWNGRDQVQLQTVQIVQPTEDEYGLVVTRTESPADNVTEVAIFEGSDQAAGDGDIAQIDFGMANDNATPQQWIAARFAWEATDVSDGSEDAQINLWTMQAGTLTEELHLDGTALWPETAGGLDLGKTGLGFNDIWLESGGIIDIAAGNVIITHAANGLTIDPGGLYVGDLTVVGNGSVAQVSATRTASGVSDHTSLHLESQWKKTNATATGERFFGLAVAGRLHLDSNQHIDTTPIGLAGIEARYRIETGGNTMTITGAAGIYVRSGRSFSPVTTTNSYGIYIEDETVGTNNYGLYIAGASTYAIWVDADPVRFDGNVEVNDATASTSGTTGSIQTDGGIGVAKKSYFQETDDSMFISVQTTSTGAGHSATVQIRAASAATGAADAKINMELTGGGEEITFGLDNDQSDRFVLSDGSALGTNDRMRIAVTTGVMSVSGDGGGSDDPVSLFDAYDDAALVRQFAYSFPAAAISEEQRLANRVRMVELGVAEWAEQEKGPDHLMIRIQPMLRLLAGGIYQQAARIGVLEQKLAALTA